MNPQAIADAITYIFENPEKAVQMGKRGRKAVETKYNWEHEKDTLCKLYRKLLNNS